MKTKQPLAINNSIVHGICNYNCITCSVNKKSYKGPREYQTQQITRKLIERVREAAEQGIYIKYIDNSGNGESTLHPEFSERMNLFGEMVEKWDVKNIPPPNVSVVTNGAHLEEKNVLAVLEKNNISLRISFPTPIPSHYGEIMLLKPEKGESLLKKVVPAIERAMSMAAEKRIPNLAFHISPPYYKYIRPDFPDTVEFLTKLAKANGMRELKLEIFPSATNRAGFVKTELYRVDLYKDYFRKYNQRKINSVKVDMTLSHKRFFPITASYMDVLKSFRYPCLWFVHFYISPIGDSCCCNDQNVQEPFGNITSHSIRELMELKENSIPKLCSLCSHTPEKSRKYHFLTGYHFLARLKSVWKLKYKKS
jgi:hypothetical protein